MVERAKEWGYIIGSCSDRPVGDQKNMWETWGIEVSFTVLKHMLDTVKSRFEADSYVHIGDTDVDYALRAGVGLRLPAGADHGPGALDVEPGGRPVPLGAGGQNAIAAPSPSHSRRPVHGCEPVGNSRWRTPPVEEAHRL